LATNSPWSQTTDLWNSFRDSANCQIIKHDEPNISVALISTSHMSKVLTTKLWIVCQDITCWTNPMKYMRSLNMSLQIKDSTQTAKNSQGIFDYRRTTLPSIQLSVWKPQTTASKFWMFILTGHPLWRIFA
jgi:hypothetical protein